VRRFSAQTKGAEYALNTQLTDRVSQWQAKLAPILETKRNGPSLIFTNSSRVIEMAQMK
jgi:hypothetical protein